MDRESVLEQGSLLHSWPSATRPEHDAGLWPWACGAEIYGSIKRGLFPLMLGLFLFPRTRLPHVHTLHTFAQGTQLSPSLPLHPSSALFIYHSLETICLHLSLAASIFQSFYFWSTFLNNSYRSIFLSPNFLYYAFSRSLALRSSCRFGALLLLSPVSYSTHFPNTSLAATG